MVVYQSDIVPKLYMYVAPGLGSTFNELLLLASPAEFIATTLYSPASSMNASFITSEH